MKTERHGINPNVPPRGEGCVEASFRTHHRPSILLAPQEFRFLHHTGIARPLPCLSQDPTCRLKAIVTRIERNCRNCSDLKAN